MPRTGSRRRLKIYLIGSGIGLGLFAVACWFALPGLVARGLIHELQSAGIPVADLHVAEVGLHEARIEGLSLGAQDELTAGEIIASYSLAGLLSRQLERIVIRDVHVVGRLEASGVSFGTLSLPHAHVAAAKANALTLAAMPPIEIDGGRLDLATLLGPVTVPFHGTIAAGPMGGLQAAIELTAKSSLASVDGHLAVRVAEGSVDTDLTIVDGTVTLVPSLSTSVSGDVRLAIGSTGHPRLVARLDLSRTTMAEAELPAGALTIDASDAEWSTHATLVGADGSSDLRADLVVADPYGEPKLSAQAAVTAGPGAWLWAVLGLPQPAQGRVDAALRLAGPLPGRALVEAPIRSPTDLLKRLAAGVVDGTVDVDAAGLVIPEIVTVARAAGSADIRASDNAIELTPRSEMRATLTLAPALRQSLALPADAARQLDGALDATMTVPAPVRIAPGSGGVTIDGEASLTVSGAAGATIEAQARGQARLTDDLAIATVDMGRSRFAVRGLSVAGSAIDQFVADGAFAGTPGKADGRFQVNATVANPQVGGFRAAGMDVTLPTMVTWVGERLSLRLANDGKAVVRQLAGAHLAGRLADIALSVPGGDEPVASLTLQDGAARAFAYDLRIGLPKVSAPLLIGGPKPVPVVVAPVPIRAGGTWSREAGYRGTVTIADGALSLPSLDTSLQGLGFDIEIPSGNDDLAAAVRIASVGHVGKPPLFVPLTVSGEARLSGDRLAFAGTLADAGKRLTVAIDGTLSLAAGKGRVKLAMQPLSFKPGRLQPRDLAPAIGAQVKDADGIAVLGGTLSWNKGRLTSDLKFMLQDLSFTLPQAGLLKLNTVLAIDRLVPFATKPDQQVAIGLIDLGIPLSDALASFRIDPGPIFAIASARLSLAGGTVTLAPAVIDPAATSQKLDLTVSDVDLGRLLELAAIDGLSATGTLAGTLPVAIESNAVVIHGAVLKATGPGVLRYAPATTPAALVGGGASVDMALQALADFHYTDLSLTLDRDAGGETAAFLQVKGNNPAFYGGYPVEFNLNVTGKLDQILDRSLAGYRVPDAIRRSLSDFPK